MTENTAQTVDQKLTDPAFFAHEDRFYDLFAQLRRDDRLSLPVRQCIANVCNNSYYRPLTVAT